VDLLQLLGSNQSRGYLAVHHPSRGEGRVYLNAGRVVHVHFDGREDAEALKLMLQDERGNFEFLPGRAAPRESITASLDNLLLSAIRTLEPPEPGDDKEIPPPDELDVPAVKDVDRVGRLTLSADEFAVIERVDGTRSVLGLAQATSLSVETVQRILMRLSSLGVLDVRKRSPRIARLVVALSRDITGLGAYLDEVIMRAWTRQFGGPVSKIRIRLDNGREVVLAAASAPDLGPYLLLSNNGLIRHNLNANSSVLVKPEA
jgi:hypothetical protein